MTHHLKQSDLYSLNFRAMLTVFYNTVCAYAYLELLHSELILRRASGTPNRNLSFGNRPTVIVKNHPKPHLIFHLVVLQTFIGGSCD